MKKYFLTIITCLVFIFNIIGIRSEAQQVIQFEKSTASLCVNYITQSGMNIPEDVCSLTTTKDQLLLSTIDLKACEAPLPVSANLRGVNFPQYLKFISTIRTLSTLDIFPETGNSQNQYFQYCFTKASYRYYIYTLKRLLI